MSSPVSAAGAVCWRMVDGTVEVLLVHRARHRDVSLPKGKANAGESLPQTAVREIREETGLTVTLGAPLGTSEYTLPGGRDKIVHYWCAEATEQAIAASRFRPGEEVAALEWLPVPQAREATNYEHDRVILDRFQQRIDAGRLRTFAIIALRHAKTLPGSGWDGPDATRPLLQHGLDQAKNIVEGIAAYGPRRLISSTATRCRSTIAPLAARTGLPVKFSTKISQDVWEGEPDAPRRVAKLVAKRLERAETVVLCSHSPVLPEIIGQVAALTGTTVDAGLRASAMLPTAGYTVLHLPANSPDSGIVAIETHRPA